MVQCLCGFFPGTNFLSQPKKNACLGRFDKLCLLRYDRQNIIPFLIDKMVLKNSFVMFYTYSRKV